MKTNELRIGSWVYNDLNKPVQVCVIEETKFSQWNGSDSEIVFIEDGEYKYSHVNPIPLTREILQQCGFFHSHNRPGSSAIMMDWSEGYWSILYCDHERLGKRYFSIKEGRYNEFHFEYAPAHVELKYLHELQDMVYMICKWYSKFEFTFNHEGL